MTEAQGDVIAAELALARTERQRQHDELVAVLTEIRDGQRELVQTLLAPMPDLPPAPCTHPPEDRTDSDASATFWKCRRCGHVYDSERETG